MYQRRFSRSETMLARACVCLFNSNYSPRAILPFLSSMTIRLRSLTLRDSPNSDSVSSPESQSQSLSFPLSHDFNAIKSSCWLVGWFLVGRLELWRAHCHFLLSRSLWLEESAAYSAKQTKWKAAVATIDHLRERIRYRADGWNREGTVVSFPTLLVSVRFRLLLTPLRAARPFRLLLDPLGFF